jgi:diaminopimelate decarboxylase
VKEIPGFKNYVSVDGGMADNPRYALYQAEYTAYIANRAAGTGNFVCTIAGCCCESGDIIGENFILPKPSPGDILAVCTTGAYNYSMASNYNRLPRPPIIILRGGESYVGVKRETFDDLILNDV